MNILSYEVSTQRGQGQAGGPGAATDQRPAGRAAPAAQARHRAPERLPGTRPRRHSPGAQRFGFQTEVQITRWGTPTTQPKETVNLDQSGCTTSDLLTRQDALRCFTTSDSGASMVEDPCFELDTQEGLMCPSAPWSTGWIQISAPGNSGTTDPPTTKGSPWGVEIASGVRCTQNWGAVDRISGVPNSYTCSDGSGLYGEPPRGTT
jgi:hypothetical protein